MDPEVYHYAYNEIYNGVLWPICHGMTAWASLRLNSHVWGGPWEGYRTYNKQVSEVIAACVPDGSLVLAQDLYFIFLMSELKRVSTKKFRSVLFLHLPFATADEFAVLPSLIAREVVTSMGHFDAVGFQSSRWQRAFSRCCDSLGAVIPRTFVATAAPPMLRFSADSASSECGKELAHLNTILGGRQMLTQLDRMDPVKNIHGSLEAYDVLLETRSDIRGKVVFVVLAHPTRGDLPDYRAYANYIRRLCRTINEKYGGAAWQPVYFKENFTHFMHVAALRRYDVLLINSIRDGMNLIALEGPQLNERHGVSVVSPEAGVFERQQEWILRSNPFDAAVTAEALYDALTLDAERRVRLFVGLYAASSEASKGDEFVRKQIEAVMENGNPDGGHNDHQTSPLSDP